jgi:FKBP-type peptidyl-prolyl cis-trans isomerase
MKRSSLTLGFLSLAALALAACGKQSATTAAGQASAIQTVDQKVSYGIGYNMGSGLTREGALTVDQAALMVGLKDGIEGSKPRLAEADIQAAFATVQQKASALASASGEKQQTAGKEYLAKNKARPGVTETATGLQYEVLVKGNGPKPKSSDTVKVHYHGTLVDGTVFDSSVQRGQPIEFAVTGVITGWTEALQLMPMGSKWKLTIPPALGYGSRANGKIPANAVLVFEVELLGIK